jgi:DNA repair photolyase
MNLFAESLSIPTRCGPATVTERPKAKVLTRPTGSMAVYDFALNPYIGCGFGCSYCYAAFFVADEQKKADWGNWVEVKTAALDELAFSERLFDQKVYMSTATDPYQPLEARVRLTRAILELISEPERQPRLVIQTRSPLVTRDIDLFRRFKNLRVNMTVSTDSDWIRQQFEPGCASIERRMDAVRELKAAGIRVGVCVCPMLPLENPRRFAHTLASLGADRYAWGDFHKSDKPFAAGTRPLAQEMLGRFGWTQGDFFRAAAVLAEVLGEKEGAFQAA